MTFAYEEPAIAPAARPGLRGLRSAGAVDEVFGRWGGSGRTIMLLSLVLVDALAAQIAFYLGAELYWAVASEVPTAFGSSQPLTLRQRWHHAAIA
jgi:hypothetical protein